MKKFLLIYAMGATLLLIACGSLLYRSHIEVARLRNNNEALTSKIKLYKNRLGESSASVAALQLQLDEYRELHARDTKQIRALRLSLKRVESVATTATHSEVEMSAPLRDTVIIKRFAADTLSLFSWSDKWVAIEGVVQKGSVTCAVQSVDTIRQVVHRVPRRFLFFRYGTKGIRQEVTSSNPHSTIIYTEYIELPKRRQRR